MGFNFATVSYLSLLRKSPARQGRGRTIAVMWFMMIVSIIFTSVLLSRLIDPYTAQSVDQIFLDCRLLALSIGLLG